MRAEASARDSNVLKAHASVLALAASSKPQPTKRASRVSGTVKDSSVLLAIGGKLPVPPDFVEVICGTMLKPRVLDLAARGATGVQPEHMPLQLTRIARLQTIGKETRSVRWTRVACCSLQPVTTSGSGVVLAKRSL